VVIFKMASSKYMLDAERRKQLHVQIEHNTVATLGGVALLVLMSMVGGSSALLAAIAGILLSGCIVLRPNARPPSWIPTVPGAEQEHIQEADMHTFIQPYPRDRMRAIILGETAVLACIFVVSIFFLPFWPNADFFSQVVALFMAFMAGSIIILSTCWISVYKQALRPK
jgi:hypothetical protein